MYLAASLVIALIFALVLTRSISKHSYAWYGITVLVIIFEWVYYMHGLKNAFPDWFTTYIMNIFQRGALATALFILVMYAGVLKPKWTVTKKLRKIRGQLAIIASLLTLGHNLIFGKTHFLKLFTNPGAMKPQHLIAAIISVIMIAIMLPLMLTSFRWLRKRMNGASWKRLQRWAYLFFALIYVHIMVLYIPKLRWKWLDIIVYTIIFVGYFLIKANKIIKAKSKNSK